METAKLTTRPRISRLMMMGLNSSCSSHSDSGTSNSPAYNPSTGQCHRISGQARLTEALPFSSYFFRALLVACTGELCKHRCGNVAANRGCLPGSGPVGMHSQGWPLFSRPTKAGHWGNRRQLQQHVHEQRPLPVRRVQDGGDLQAPGITWHVAFASFCP